jgi:hypothetical protein
MLADDGVPRRIEAGRIRGRHESIAQAPGRLNRQRPDGRRPRFLVADVPRSEERAAPHELNCLAPHKDCWTTDPAKCHFNLVAQDSDWETNVCSKLEEMDEVRAHAKNRGIGFRIPYTCDGRAGSYYPDLIVRIDAAARRAC